MGSTVAPEGTPESKRLWVRAAGLFLLAMGAAVFSPFVLVGVPLFLLTVALPGPKAQGFWAAGLVLVLLVGWGAPDGFWYLERGWAVLLGGWFGALTWRWPHAGVTHRALGAVGATAAAFGLYFATHPLMWQRVDWRMRTRVGGDLMSTFENLRLNSDVPSDFVQSFETLVELQALTYPAFIGLASFAALGVSWWLYIRVSHGRSDGLGPLREFRFHDGLVWLVVIGVAMLVLGGGSTERLGTNALVFMGGLYALRGVAVFLFFKGTVTVLAGVLFVLAAFVAMPAVIGVAVALGLGDTWLGLRQKARAMIDRSV